MVRSVKTAPSAARRSIYYTKFEPRKIEDEFFVMAYDIDTNPNDICHCQVRTGALVDRGANGGIAGDDVWIFNCTGQQVDVQGIDNHQIVDISIVTWLEPS
jgi:hypothetical protein